MMPDRLNAEIIKALREKFPKRANIANLLMDILSIGKEAVYRRLRGEVPFTLSEAMRISQNLGISLDKMNGITFDGDHLLDFKFFQSEIPEKTYISALNYYLNLLRNISFHPENKLWDITNHITHLFNLSSSSSSLTRFILFKWIYQHEIVSSKRILRSYEDISVPDDLKVKEREITEALLNFPRNYYIWDNMVIQSVITDIHYFKEINLISYESLQDLKIALLLLIDKLEEIASNGYHANGNEVQIYISNVNFGTSYSYIDTVDQRISFIKVYGMDIITSHNTTVFENMRLWVQSMKRFSILISQSADMFRYKFFQQQREYVNRL